MAIDLTQFNKQAKHKRAESQQFFERLKKQKPNDLDEKTHQLHDNVFKKIDCLSCANCCKTTGPLFTQRDIKVISKHLKLSEHQFIQKYLRIDEDNDYVLQQLPCVFLGADNYCGIYDYRPQACREFPHTNQRKIHTILKETLNNTEVCPAVFEIVERLKKIYP
ncbi:MAG: YkgJ family cysteine cluster protein [Bacteroidia bacterium]|nr:YkgJ family cysteine cluster protein [Bacteroidia bacterium]